MSAHRVLALVPARGGSRRIPRKNLQRLGGRSLVRRTLETAVAATRVDAVALSSDDPAILAEAGGLDVLTRQRPAVLATDTASSYDAAMDVLAVAEAALGAFDVIALLQCTTPFATSEDLDGALELLARTPRADSVVTVGPAPDLGHPSKLKLLEGDRLVPLLEDDELRPSHELPDLWVRNGALYASRRHVLAGGRLLAPDVLGYPMPAERSVDVNTPLDLAFCEFLLTRSATPEISHG